MRKREFYEITEKDFSKMTKEEVRENTKNAVRLLSDICNFLLSTSFNLFYDFRELVTRLSENEKAKENMEALSAEWVRVLHKQREEHRYDARNEYSVFIGEELYDLYQSEPWMEGNSIFREIANEMGFQHRTIHQTFSGLIFEFLNKVHPEIALEDSWHKCPMI